MKAIKATQQNAQLIAFRLKQFFSRHECTQSYTDWGWYPKYLNRMGVKPEIGTKHIERTITSYGLSNITKVRVENDYGIIINIGKAYADCIHLGYKIKIAPNRITISGYDNLMKQNFVSYYFPCSDIEKANGSIQYNEYMDAQYWKEVEKEYLKEEKEIEHEHNNV